MPQVRHSDPDLIDSVSAVDAAIRERHHAAPVAPPARKDVRAAVKAVNDAQTCIHGVLWRPMHAPDIAKFTGVPVGTVCATLIELEAMGRVRKTGERAAGWDGDLYELWERVL
jgi:predicted Rossmann fold nucleotide-binding protein DprA/Smf involved in DNA uptake